MESEVVNLSTGPSDTSSTSLQETITRTIREAPQGANLKDIFVQDVWSILESEYETMVHKLVEFCKSKLHQSAVACNITGRAKSCDSIEKSFDRRETARMKKLGAKYENLRDVLDDIHDLAGIRIVVDFRSDVDAVSAFIKQTFQQLKEPNVFSADRKVGEIWQPLFGAYKTCNHRVAARMETHDTLSRYCGVMFEIQLTDISESLYNRFAHSLLYKKSSGRLHRQDEIVIDMSHGISLLYSLCLMYMQNRLEGSARGGDDNDKLLGAMKLAEAEGNLDILVETVPKTTGSDIGCSTGSSGTKSGLKRRASFREAIPIATLKRALRRAEEGSSSTDELWQLISNKFDATECKDDQESVDADAWIRYQHYNADRLKIERLSGDLLPMDQCYINLAIVEQQGQVKQDSKNADTPSPFSILNRQRVAVQKETAQIELSTLFNERRQHDNRMAHPRRILIRGRAGVGKTTLCKKMVHDFTHGKQTVLYGAWTKLFDRLLWVPLRNLKRRSAPGYNHEDMFYHEYFSGKGYDKGRRLAAGLWRTLDNTKSERTLFILDGLDEVTELMNRESEMFDFLQDLLHQPNAIITSRPNAILPASVRNVDLELETIGFYPAQVEAYLKADPKMNSRFSEVQQFLRHHWLLQGLVRIPIQLDALCYTWEDFDHGTTPDTMTDIYKTIEERLWKKDILRLEKKHDGEAISRFHMKTIDVEDFVKSETYLLEGLGFTGLHNNLVEFTSEHLRTTFRHFKAPGILLDKTLSRLSFLRTSNAASEWANVNYHFLHLTFQEYFAAQYFVQQWTSGEKLAILKLGTRQGRTIVKKTTTEEFLQSEKYNARYDVFWRFVAGLLGGANYDEDHLCRFFQTIERQPRDLFGPVHQRLIMHCLYEAGHPEETSKWVGLRQSLEAQLKDWLLFECKFGRVTRRERHFPYYPRLSAQMEFPDLIVEAVLREETESIQLQVLQSLVKRPSISQAVVNCVVFWSTGTILVQPKQKTVETFRNHLAPPEEVTHALVALSQHSKNEIRSFAVTVLLQQSPLPGETVQAIMALCKDPETTYRNYAVAVLRVQPRLSVEALQTLMAADAWDSEPSGIPVVRMNLEQNIQGLVTMLQDADVENRLFAAEILRSYPNPPESVLKPLIASLQDTDGRVRGAAAEALEVQSNLLEESVLALIALLQSPGSDIRSSVSATLCRQSTLSEGAILALVALLNDSESDCQSFVARVLGTRPTLPDDAIQALIASLQHPDGQTRLLAAQALGRRSNLSENALQTLVTSLSKHPNAHTRLSAAYALSFQDLSENVSQVLVASLLHDPDNDTRSSAALALGQQSDLPEDAMHALITSLLHDPEASTRLSAALALGKQSDLPEHVVQALVTSLSHDPEEGTRSRAALALGKQSDLPEHVTQALTAFLSGDADDEAKKFVETVLRIQPDLSKDVIQCWIKSLLTDANSCMRLSAANILTEQSRQSEHVLRAYVSSIQDADIGVQDSSTFALRHLSTLSSERFTSFLLLMDSSSFQAVYGMWLRRSFSNHLVWYGTGKDCRIVVPETEWELPFDRLKSAVEEARNTLKVPGGIFS
ncbi:armadillo-type protein [Dactylonectria macrodidyma]|uniref:Armadillo-type protein n=1 Tax=Dactylonectria macrodidyma TaxID=307937 RepID=A0A9P9IIA6_9HYPO|nr:armadillo-type protein [Dactylonectria macrodidyma]